MKLTFWGAARQVTGSMHLLDLDSGTRILIDCGLDYDQKHNFFNNPNASFPFDPTSIDLIILTHAHVDHSGNIPNLVKQGFSGKIISTPATADLTDFLLMDSVNIQKADIRKNSRKKGKQPGKQNQPQPLYLQKHVMDTMDLFFTINYHRRFEIEKDTWITFHGAGHLLGAASVLVETVSNGKPLRIGFTGDLGKDGSKLVQDPEIMEDLDYLITESTYGARMHKANKSAEEEMYEYIKSTCVDMRGRLVIPAFSVGRTQSIVFTLNQLHKAGLLPPVKVFVDSPLAIKSTRIYDRYMDQLNIEAKLFYKAHGDLFQFEELQEVAGNDASDEIKYYYDPCIIISAAGMVEGGRIQEHVMNNIQNPQSTILIAGFCAEGTLGWRLLQGQPSINIKSKDRPVYARISSTDVFSAHPDQKGLVKYITETAPKAKTFLVHGEETGMQTLQQVLTTEHNINSVEIPEKGQEYIL